MFGRSLRGFLIEAKLCSSYKNKNCCQIFLETEIVAEYSSCNPRAADNFGFLNRVILYKEEIYARS